MPLQTATGPSEDIERSPSFTLGTALLLLGHDCRGQCPRPVTNRRASIWFLHLPDRMVVSWIRTLIDVEFSDALPPDEGRAEMLSQVNFCVRADNMRVREQSAAERAAFFAALVARGTMPKPSHRSSSLVADLCAVADATQ